LCVVFDEELGGESNPTFNHSVLVYPAEPFRGHHARLLISLNESAAFCGWVVSLTIAFSNEG